MSTAGLLLRGAFLEGSAALDAWDAWHAGTSLDAVDPECYAMLPLLHRKLEALGADHAELGRLKGVRRRTWLENQMVLREAAQQLQCLRDAGIDTLLLGGLALVTGYYHDPGLRRLREIEILVRRKDAARAAGLLAQAPPRVMLRRRALFLGCPQRIEEAWWAAAVPVRVLEVESRVLAPADQLLHTLVGGMRWNHSPPGWWMADSLVVLGDSRIDAGRIVDFATRLRVTLFLCHALEQLDGVLGRPAAPELLDALRRSPMSFADRLEYQYVSRPRRQRPLLSWLVAPSRRFRRSHS
jgi:putative nucleotidyltransferase-like protein